MALVSTMSVNRFMYWLQLHEKIGPIVINMTRVARDILTMAGTYIIICVAFSSGLVFALSNHHEYVNKYIRLDSVGSNTNVTAYAQSFGDTMYILFWTILDPGPKEEIMEKGKAQIHL